MGNCYGEDGDSEDECYGYYGKNNRLKPQPSPIPPESTYHNTHREDETEADWETNNKTDENNEEYEDGEIEGVEGDEGYEPEYEGDEEEELVYRPEHGDAEQEYEDGIDERGRLETGNDEVYELRELEHESQERYELEYEPERSDSDAHYGIHEPRTLKSSGVPQRAEPKYEGPGRHTHAHHYPTPTLRNTPRSNQRGRATAVKDVRHCTPPYPTQDYSPAHTRSRTTINNHDPIPSHANSQHHTPYSTPHHPPTHTLPIEPAHGTTPNPSIAQLRPPPWPDNTHNPHLLQSRPPPWPD
jgi:hypothetical protein